MERYARLVAVVAGLGMTGFGYQHYGTFRCDGQFGRFANGHLASMPSQLTFVIDWQMPGIVTDTGIPGRITAWTPIELAFDVEYPTYKASYFINRIDGSISETSNFGGLFHGVCDLTPLETKF
jgi:hypothetical protein